MNLVIDIGNTAIKMAVFQNNKMLEKRSFPKEDFFENFKYFQESFQDIRFSIVSDVGKDSLDILSEVKEHFPLLEMSQELNFPFKNNYATPASLGKDRLALIAAAVNIYPGKNVLVIDAGTCITYDIKTRDEVYLGGAISPGMGIRFRSLHKFTANLPLVIAEPEPLLIGNSTETSILSGIINGLKMELKGTIESYTSEFEDLTVILTGGDSQILSMPLKNSIFANSNFLLEGLNFILEFNKTQ